MLFLKELREYTLFGCEKWKDLQLGAFRNRVVHEPMTLQRKNWGDGELPMCYRWKEFGLYIGES